MNWLKPVFLFLGKVIWLWLTLSLLWPGVASALDNTPAARPPLPEGVNYVVVAPAGLAETAQAWATYRQQTGYQTKLLLVAPEQATIEVMRPQLQAIYEASGRPYPFYLLLVGQAHTPSAVETYLPAVQLPLDLPSNYLELVPFATIATDDGLAMVGEELLPWAIGRVPGRSKEEVLRVLQRTQAYEQNPPTGLPRTQVELIASESRFGLEFDLAIEQLVTFYVEQYLPAYYRWHLLYGRPGTVYSYPARQFPAAFAERLAQQTVLTTYIGHGSATYLGPALDEDGTEGPIFTTAHLPLPQAAAHTIFVTIACSAGEYDRPGSLAEELLLQPNGVVASYAASRLTLPAVNTLLGKDIFQLMLTGEAHTAGEWIWRAENNYRNPGADRSFSVWLLARLVTAIFALTIQNNPQEIVPASDLSTTFYKLQQHSYNLFGDPALVLAVPRPVLEVAPRWWWQPFGQTVQVSGRGDLPEGQMVELLLYTPQGTVLPAPYPAGNLAEQNQQTNDKLVSYQQVTTAGDGSFAGEIKLPNDLPAGHYILQVVTSSGHQTLVGTHTVYVGWTAVFELLALPAFWWLLLTIGFAYQLISKLRRKV